jgi:acetyltransferase-like isoleucine patch superfamily enzyme
MSKIMLKFFLKIIYHKLKHPKAYISWANVSLDCILGDYVKVFKGTTLGSCKIDSYSYIGTNCDFARTNMGAFCSVGPEVICGVGTHPTNHVSTYPGFYSKHASGSYFFGFDHEFSNSDKKRVEIGSDVWIGARALIMGGISIGHGAIIGAGAVVTKDVPPYAIVGGVPAKLIRYRFDPNLIEQLLLSAWWELPEKK